MPGEGWRTSSLTQDSLYYPCTLPGLEFLIRVLAAARGQKLPVTFQRRFVVMQFVQNDGAQIVVPRYLLSQRMHAVESGQRLRILLGQIQHTGQVVPGVLGIRQ